MLRAGRIYTLEVRRISDFGLYLAQPDGGAEGDAGEGAADGSAEGGAGAGAVSEVLLPNRYVSLSNRVGDRIEVFVYHDSEDRLVATTERPLLRAGEAGFLRVVDKTLHGAFLDWGLKGKDLFLPNRNQQGAVTAGRTCLVYLYEDNITGRCVATQRLKSYVHNVGELTVAPHDEVELLVASRSESGWRVIVNHRHWGMLYDNQLFRPVRIGDRLRGYVARVTDDNRIDLTLQTAGLSGVQESARRLESMLRDAGGFLPLNDASDPADVAARTEMSKKQFKRALGMLLKSGAVEQTDEGIRLK